MRICIDSCVFIHGIQQDDPQAVRLLDIVSPELTLVTPRLIAQEVSRNLVTPGQVRTFYRLFYRSSFAFIIDEPLPSSLMDKCVALGLRQKADAFIGAFAEWRNVDYLISDNRHFLRELDASSFAVLDADGFVTQWEAGALQ